ncbi:hypothetical protein GUJ93_ZPchr0001g32374 [Zizania palustris]|uniref:Uncharacterized protein n=1 Tax=Zizania palustris TaxID=103762 RepID=A0A8J5RNA9_ZIZPA|nr:hypothetical protein GUJ93_ZPchr0001g32374 [Zizania palustris]
MAMGKPSMTIIILCPLLVLVVATTIAIGPDHGQDDVSTYIIHVMLAYAPHLSKSHRATIVAHLSCAYTSFLCNLFLPVHTSPTLPLASSTHTGTL